MSIYLRGDDKKFYCTGFRAGADELITDIWDEIEFKYRKDEPSAMRRKAREYGVVYVSRPGEPVEEGAQPPAPETPVK